MYRKLQSKLLTNQTHVDHDTVQHVDNSQILQTAVVSSSVDQHSSLCQDEFEKVLSTVSPLVRPRLRHAFYNCLVHSLNATDDVEVPDGHTQPRDEPQPNRKPMKRRCQRRFRYRGFQTYETPLGRFYTASYVETESKLVEYVGQTSNVEDTYIRSRFTFVPATWLSCFGLSHLVDVALAKTTTSGWQFSLNIPRLVPDKSQIFERCRTGDVDGVRELLYQRRASVRDVNSSGSTPLHVAARYNHPDLCQILIAESADVDALDFRNISPFIQATISPHSEYYKDGPSMESRQIRTFRQLIKGGVDIESEEEAYKISMIISSMGNVVATERMQGTPRIHFQFPSHWIFKQLLPSILANPCKYDQYFWADLLITALVYTPNTTPAAEILPYCEPQVVRIALLRWCSGL